MEGREFKDAVFEQFARVASAFASPKRLEIVDLLAQGPRSVESIAAQTSMTVSATSRHLQVLRNAGLVTSSRDAQRVVYRVADLSVVAAYRALREAAEARIAEVRQLAEAFFGEVDGAEPLGVEELLERSGRGDVIVVDVRPAEEFAAGHIAGAVSMPLADLTERIADLPSDATVVAYCRGPYCVLSAEAVRRLRAAGVAAQRVEAGIDDWRRAGRSLEFGAA
ncbi:ArsR/SmtB family transcription factor [Nocardioides sp. T2.26MG-1]|uniref:ArsR/SmtB family transcription factor n=1 Tax=Nocardioides sp. T2.26MG-1 TaxID=3041166 RepID=UPI002477551C|nr:metalloregulator ArsR/SmtB family transcription factor [Nocardioides sp. T2.26MG-1]CAI9416344.1 Thiosulfate sulfurtransferase GlpE [Nocardioides sp. T2.26MG-1]